MNYINTYEILRSYTYDLRYIEDIFTESILARVSLPNNNTRSIITGIFLGIKT